MNKSQSSRCCISYNKYHCWNNRFFISVHMTWSLYGAGALLKTERDMCESPSYWGQRSNTYKWHHYACGCKVLVNVLGCHQAKCEIDIQMWGWHPNMSLTFKDVWQSSVSLTFKCEIDIQIWVWRSNVIDIQMWDWTSKYEFDGQMWDWRPNEFDIQMWYWHPNMRLTFKYKEIDSQTKKYFWHCSLPICARHPIQNHGG